MTSLLKHMFQYIGHPTVCLSLPPSLTLPSSLPLPCSFWSGEHEEISFIYSQRGECDDRRGNVTNQQRAVIHWDKTGQYCWTPTPRRGMYEWTEKTLTGWNLNWILYAHNCACELVLPISSHTNTVTTLGLHTRLSIFKLNWNLSSLLLQHICFGIKSSSLFPEIYGNWEAMFVKERRGFGEVSSEEGGILDF